MKNKKNKNKNKNKTIKAFGEGLSPQYWFVKRWSREWQG